MTLHRSSLEVFLGDGDHSHLDVSFYVKATSHETIEAIQYKAPVLDVRQVNSKRD